MRTVVFNGSPRGAKGNTEVLVQAFLSGAREAGSEIEVVYLKDKTINYCTGCFTCWTKTPGICIHKDDVPELHQKMRKADVIVYATPLYVYTVTGLMKDFMDRILPLVEPFVEVNDGLCDHPMRHKDGEKSIVLISNCGFPEPDHFNGLKETFNQCFGRRERGIAGIICCAAGPLLTIPEMKMLYPGTFLLQNRLVRRLSNRVVSLLKHRQSLIIGLWRTRSFM